MRLKLGIYKHNMTKGMQGKRQDKKAKSHDTARMFENKSIIDVFNDLWIGYTILTSQSKYTWALELDQPQF